MGFDGVAGKADEYRHYAQECLEAASRIHSEEERSILLHIAQTWHRFADQEEDSPPPKQPQQQVQPDDDDKRR
jgi:hypothetical protein